LTYHLFTKNLFLTNNSNQVLIDSIQHQGKSFVDTSFFSRLTSPFENGGTFFEREKNVKKLTLTVLLFLTACVENPLLPTEPTGNEKQHFKNTVTIQDAPSQSVVTFSTLKGFQDKHDTYNVVWDDNFLRGFTDKKTKVKTYQVYNVIYYAVSGVDSKRKHFLKAKYQTEEGEKIISTNIIKEHEDCTALQFHGQCLYSEHVVFNIQGTLLRTLANSYALNTPNKNRSFRYQLISKSGENYDDKLQIAEIAGLVEKMDEYVIQRRTDMLDERWDEKEAKHPALQPDSSIEVPEASVLLPLLKQ
jgi:ligand-binding SRPBCC domain-containing protein